MKTVSLRVFSLHTGIYISFPPVSKARGSFSNEIFLTVFASVDAALPAALPLHTESGFGSLSHPTEAGKAEDFQLVSTAPSDTVKCQVRAWSRLSN